MAANNVNDDDMNLNNNRITLGQYINPTAESCGSTIRRPAIQANNFELKSSLIQLVQQDQFSGKSRAQIDSSAGGSLHTKTVEEAQDLIELIANNQYLYSTHSERNNVKKGVMEAEAFDTLVAQNKALAQQINLLSSKLGNVQLAAMNTQIGSCDLCGN
ncbi:hypothetical protein PIB30_024039 [Stylosanthes scabra]|uniref:Uncharacterized protein n=1 Tax=Stylosanthes scabra TaxID=79078 RepID=A0ABU6R9X7_9FABA|nr:hypothetical protein [Stylosanthes scabra]